MMINPQYLLVIVLIFLLNMNSVVFTIEIKEKELNNLRIKYYTAVENEDAIEDLNNYLSEVFNTDKKRESSLYIAYLGGIAALKSKHAFWPIKKINNLKESMKYLKTALSLESDNLEIRFMRFSILHYVPGFLGYSEERGEDARVICRLLLKKDYSVIGFDIQKGIVEFMIRSERLTSGEIHQLKNNFSFLN